MNHTQKWQPIDPALRRVQEIARAKRGEVFTSLAHHLSEQRLTHAYRGLKAKAAGGWDGQTKASYGRELEANISDLHGRLKDGSYRATAAKRVMIDKPEGGQRALDLPTVEDKMVQGAVVDILHSIYEVDFAAFSYGSRPGKSQHQCLQALQTVLRLIGQWLTVGYRDDNGQRHKQRRGTPQGAPISSLLANIVLNEAMDQPVHRWRQQQANGEVYIVRYADDAVIGFEHYEDALALKAELEHTLAAYGLSLNEAKTRVLRFGRQYPPSGPGRSETFDFLGFTHIAGRDRKGRYLVKRKTAPSRIKRSLQAVKRWCQRHRHAPIAWQHKELSLKITGHYAYYGVRGNFESLARFRHRVWSLWRQSLRRRSQTSRKSRITTLLNERFVLPQPRITHPDNWLPVDPGYLLGRAGCGKAARPAL